MTSPITLSFISFIVHHDILWRKNYSIAFFRQGDSLDGIIAQP